MPAVFQYPDYIGRTDQDTIEQALDHISRCVTNNDIEFLLGAGMSRDNTMPKDARLPLGSEVARMLPRYFFPSEGSNPPSEQRLSELCSEYPFEAIVEALEKVLGTRDRLTAALKEMLWDDKYGVGQAHRDFHAICNWNGLPRVARFFTTNFDKLLSKTFGDQGVQITERNAKEIRKVQEAGRIAIILLHGALDSDYQISERDLFDKQYRMLNDEFHSALHTAGAFVFVGYSMNDPDFRRIYMQYRAEISDRGEPDKMTYYVAPAKDEFAYRLGKAIWDRRRAVWLPFDSENFFSGWKAFLSRREDRRVREAVAAKYGLTRDDQQAFEELVSRTMGVLRVERFDAIQFLYEARTRTGEQK